jgi:carbon-monoxide dehydrogenase medium subunit
MQYQRPRTIAEAVALLRAGVPLAGGTHLVPRRFSLDCVVDLQDLPLKEVRPSREGLEIGAMCRLQDLVEAAVPARETATVTRFLADACREEAGWNLRNMITIGGTIACEDGRSRVLTVLTALKAVIRFEPGGQTVSIGEVLAGRPDLLNGRLVTAVLIPAVLRAEYQQVARSPADTPIVCVAACRGRNAAGTEFLRLALGGFGSRPLGIDLGPQGGQTVTESAATLAREAYARAEDQWATAEYRSHVAGALARRVVAEVVR